MILELVALVTLHTPKVVFVDRDNVQITQSCALHIKASPIVDADNNGVIHITGNDIEVLFPCQDLAGAAESQSPDAFTGIGVRITGKNVKLRGTRIGANVSTISGYKVGVHATDADGLEISGIDFSNNFRHRLKSTPKAEDASDWLWPHENDNNEWMTNYGAALCVEDADRVVIHDIRVRNGQNGIILDCASDSRVYDCDCSFLSGWGLAMWRSSRNVISRNAFDFCVRGYSHGVYNRGQDSAGILIFEQCCDNVIAENSVTHGGDGIFGFAGKESLGEVKPRENLDWYRRRGCNGNIFSGNDLSYAAAHGLELTFSFDNTIQNNRFWNNAICGIWGGYSQSTLIRNNSFDRNGGMGYGAERGGIAIEHGARNVISENQFFNNTCAIRLWWDDDQAILERPWAKANETRSTGNQILFNSFKNNRVTLELDQSSDTTLHLNKGALHHPMDQIQADQVSLGSITFDAHATAPGGIPVNGVVGSRNPVVIAGGELPHSARAHLAGRENIMMTEWGPWDHESPLLQFVQHVDHGDEFRLLCSKTRPLAEQIQIEGEAVVEVQDDRIRVLPKGQNVMTPYRITFEVEDHEINATGLLTGGTWNIKTFPSIVDPRENADQWRASGLANSHEISADLLELRYSHGSISDALQLPVTLPSDHFGTIATRSLTFPSGRWRIKTISDDGIRVWLDDKLIIDDWTWHAPKDHTYEFDVEQPRELNLRVEHFELDGYAVLSVQIEPAN